MVTISYKQYTRIVEPTELLKRYSEDIPHVNTVSKSAEIADLVMKLGESTERKNSNNFIVEQLDLLCLSHLHYRYKADTIIVAFQPNKLVWR